MAIISRYISAGAALLMTAAAGLLAFFAADASVSSLTSPTLAHGDVSQCLTPDTQPQNDITFINCAGTF